jgi:ABC-type glycerol-3-phosphate transport system substrate-binding protein
MEVVMKSLALSAALVICLGLSACAGTAGGSGFVRSGSMDSNLDYGKVITVNQWAETRGATVVWINYPTLPTKAHDKDG